MSSSASETPSNKRKFTPEESLVTLSKKKKSIEPRPIRHSEFWYEDGNVVIQIDDIHFKLYRGQLSRISTFFADLFKENLIHWHMDGCPLYRVEETTAEDFEAVLAWMQDHTSVFMKTSWPKHHILASVVRASTTLRFPSFRGAACYILKDIWCSDLSSYDPEDELDHAADIIILAKQCDIPDVRKRAYYELLQSAGFKQTGADPVVALPSEELNILVTTRELLSEAWARSISFPTEWEACFGKPPGPSLKERKLSWYKQVHESGLAREWAHDPIGGLNVLQKKDWRAERMCDDCVDKRLSEWADKKSEIWDKLDSWLGLDDDQ